jgi:hypothetical protein
MTKRQVWHWCQERWFGPWLWVPHRVKAEIRHLRTLQGSFQGACVSGAVWHRRLGGG